MKPDKLVEIRGQPVTLTRVTSVVYDEWDNLDGDASTDETEEILAVVTRPSDEQIQDLQGRGLNASRKLTVKSSVDIQANRQGGSDEVVIDGETYEVIEVQEETHVLAGYTKKTVLVDNVR